MADDTTDFIREVLVSTQIKIIDVSPTDQSGNKRKAIWLKKCFQSIKDVDTNEEQFQSQTVHLIKYSKNLINLFKETTDEHELDLTSELYQLDYRLDVLCRLELEYCLSSFMIDKIHQISSLRLEDISFYLDFIALIYEEGNMLMWLYRWKSLWTVVILNSKCNEKKDVLFSWLYKMMKRNTKLKERNNRTRIAEGDFETILGYFMKLEPSSFTRAATKCFKRFFFEVNVMVRGNIVTDCKKLSTFTVKKRKLIGLSHLWSIIMETHDDEAANVGIKVMIKLFSNLAPDLKSCLKQFQTYCFLKIRDLFYDQTDTKPVCRILSILKAFDMNQEQFEEVRLFDSWSYVKNHCDQSHETKLIEWLEEKDRKGSYESTQVENQVKFNESRLCPICLSHLRLGVMVTLDKCNHVVCKDCFPKIGPECPECRCKWTCAICLKRDGNQHNWRLYIIGDEEEEEEDSL